ncbi:MAG: carbonic anhydrase [Chloroflexota bacterium]
MTTSDQTMQELIEGNCRFVNSFKERARQSGYGSVKVSPHPRPQAVVLCCCDLGIPPEIIFDQCLGSLVTVRTAANVVDEQAVDVIKYMAEQYGVSLVVVVGHHNCNAVAAAIQTGQASGDLDKAIKHTRLSLRRSGNHAVARAVQANVQEAVHHLRTRQADLAELVKHNDLFIVGAIYNPQNGKVEFTQ